MINMTWSHPIDLSLFIMVLISFQTQAIIQIQSECGYTNQLEHLLDTNDLKTLMIVI